MKTQILCLTIFAFFASLTSVAQDKATLDLLVSKGLITREDADKVSKNETRISVVARNKDTKKIQLSGLVQTQYEWVDTRASAPVTRDAVSRNGFAARRLFLGIHGELGHGFTAGVVADFAASGPEHAKFLNDAWIAKDFDGEYIKGRLMAGYNKVQFGYEENMSATALVGIERSVASRYFVDQAKNGSGNVGFGSRYTGLFWKGEVRQIEGLEYGFALTNSQNFSLRPSADSNFDNSLNMWANVLYKGKADIFGSLLAYKTGVNFGYGNGANPTFNGATQNGEIWGVNPYLELQWQGLRLWSDFIITGIEHGRNNGTENATPFGFNIAFEYKFDIGEFGAIAPAFRYSYLDTDGRGVRPSDGVFGASNPDPSGLYNNAHTVYLGLNWYIIGNALKLQAGYEWARFEGSPASESGPKKADANAFRMQMQVVF